MNILNRLDMLVNEIPEEIIELSGEELSHKRAPDKWSKKEILGHLCDSAFNNHSRFIRAQFEDAPFKLIPYKQNEWVKFNHYQQMDINDIINLWVTLNKQIHNVISNIPEAKLDVECDLGEAAFREGEKTKSLFWLIEDYILHMEYHLNQVVNVDWLRGDYGKS
jgi:hypothetical protein